MRGRQLGFLPRFSIEHGGSLARGRRKTRRPLDPKRPIHLVLRSSRARREASLLHPRRRRLVRDIVLRAAARHGVRVMSFVNVGNHLHILVRTPTRPAFQNFLRQAAGHVAQAVTGAVKGRAVAHQRPPGGIDVPPSARRKFWDSLAYTRVVSWGRDRATVARYFVKNLAEALGLPRPRKGALIIPKGVGPPIGEVWVLNAPARGSRRVRRPHPT